MKKLILSLLLFVISIFCYGQQTIDLTFDLEKKTINEKAYKKKFKTGDSYKVKIKNHGWTKKQWKEDFYNSTKQEIN